VIRRGCGKSIHYTGCNIVRSATRRSVRPAIRKGDNEESRCEITGNLVGTDTWAVGYDCQCAPCQRMLREGAAAIRKGE